METLFLSRHDVESTITMRDAIKAVESGFREKENVEKSVKAWLFFKKQGGDLALWSAYIPKLGAAGMKAIGYNTKNPSKGIPTITAIITLYDPDTSYPLAIMDGTSITRIRTGAAGAVASKYLARKDSETAAIIGAGAQGSSLLEGLFETFPLKKAWIYDIQKDQADVLATTIENKHDANVIVARSVQEAVKQADIISSAVPSHEPVIMNDWIKSGTHLNAIGADEPGKQELDPEILRRALIVVDDKSESIRRGETNVALSKGIIKESDLYAELSEIILGKKKGRENDSQITVFDATGIALEDVATAWEVYNRAKNKGLGEYRSFVT